MRTMLSLQTLNKNAVTPAALTMRLVALFWLLAKFIGWKVWIKDRLFPLAPVAQFTNWPSVMQYALFVLSLALILFIAFKPQHKIALASLLCVEILNCAADQNRWQPWEYQYLFTVTAALINFKDPKKFVSSIAFIMAATYLYSGIGKFNEGYLVLVWDNIFLKKIFKLSESVYQQKHIHYLGYATALAETLFAIGLFFSKTKKASAWGMIAMHLLILYAIGPLGINYNTVVWPWNILMILLLFFLFIRNSSSPLHLPDLWLGANKIVLLAWGVMPALNYAGLWDNYLSARLYSGGLPLMAVCIKDPGETEELRPYFNQTDTYRLCNGNAMINLQNWAMKEMNVPPYPEMRVYKLIAQNWQDTHSASSVNFVYYYFIKQKEIKLIGAK